jgi:hypothetical protein
MEEYAAFITSSRNQMNKHWKQLRVLLSRKDKTILDGFKVTWRQFIEIDQRIQTLSRENGNNEARALSQGDARIAFDKAVTALSGLEKVVDLTLNNASNLESRPFVVEHRKLFSSLVNYFFRFKGQKKT